MTMLKSASGYGGIEATPLARPGYFNEIIANVYERDFLPEITNNQIDQRIIQCHQVVQIMKSPKVAPWRTYSKNQPMEPSQITASATCLVICNAAYNCIKIDEQDIWQACERWDEWEAKFLEEAYESYVTMQREWVLTAMIIETDPRNKGSRAGIQYRNIDLGSRGNPKVITKDTLINELALLQQVLMQSQRWRNGEMFAVMPIQFRPVLYQTDYVNANLIGNCMSCSPLIDGMWDMPIMGFKIIETIHAPSIIEDDGRVCFFVIVGHSQAFAYAADIIRGRVVEEHRSFGIQYQMLAVWGGKMLYEDAVAVGYWTFDAEVTA